MALRRQRAQAQLGQVGAGENKRVVLGERGNKRQTDAVEPPSKRPKRAAFGDLTNQENKEKGGKKPQKKAGTKVLKQKGNDVLLVPRKSTSKSSLTSSQGSQNVDVSFDVVELSQGSQESQSSSQSSSSEIGSQEVVLHVQSSQPSQPPAKEEEPEWEDMDKDQMGDPFQVALYAHDIFEYYKERELKFQVCNYLATQKDLQAHMRAILVDWLVEVQENFELNHETLYLAVRIVDHYLSLVTVRREQLQLVGAASMFISCKFDERSPPVVDDFMYICDDAYQREEVITMERTILRTIGFDLGHPLSYRFLRRYSRCARSPIETLTLGRFILETSLMEYSFVTERPSIVAAAAFHLAQKMRGNHTWSGTMLHYTGYSSEELLPLVIRLNKMISGPPNRQLNTIRTKYSHKLFHEVAKVSALAQAELESPAVSDEETAMDTN